MKYKILEHPSELKIIVYGKTLEELFSNAVLAMGEIMARELGTGKWELGMKEKIKIKSADLNSLLVDFLSEILAKSQINKKVYRVAKIKIDCHPELVSGSHRYTDSRNNEMPDQVRHDDKDESYFLESELFGYSVTHFDEDIKAVTYEDLDIKQVDGIWQTMVVFDI
jgi:SHS2 domain-containing protein